MSRMKRMNNRIFKILIILIKKLLSFVLLLERKWEEREKLKFNHKIHHKKRKKPFLLTKIFMLKTNCLRTQKAMEGLTTMVGTKRLD